MKTVKIFFLRFIKFVPFNILKIYLLKKCFNYSIGKNVKIGKSIINCNKVTIGDNVYIANYNIFSCNELVIGSNTKIQSGNIVRGKGLFSIGENSRIINNHYFDVWNSIKIGDNTWIAGRNSEFWTHGSLHTKQGNKDLSINIGDNVYVSSNCLFAPGVKISNINLIGLGSVLTKKFNDNSTVIAGNPAIVIKNNINWKENW